MLVVCPHCGTTVRPGRDGSCPSCRKLVTQFEYFAAENVDADSDRSSSSVQHGQRVRTNSGAQVVPIEICSRRRGLVGILAGALLCLVLVAQAVTGQGNFIIYGFLVFVGMMLLAQIRLFLFPPRLAIHAGWFEARGLGAIRVPIEDVADLRLHNRHPLVILRHAGAVEPARQREPLARSAAARGFHFALPKGSFNLSKSSKCGRLLHCRHWSTNRRLPTRSSSRCSRR